MQEGVDGPHNSIARVYKIIMIVKDIILLWLRLYVVVRIMVVIALKLIYRTRHKSCMDLAALQRLYKAITILRSNKYR